LHPSDFSGVTPKKKEMQTPNPIATPLRTPSGAATPLRTPNSLYSMVPKGTPIRDDLHINEDSEMLGSESAKADKLRQVIRSPNVSAVVYLAHILLCVSGAPRVSSAGYRSSEITERS
jgi:pre-mRNA-splicing factor CDC5/CEF1